ncbi:MAG: type III-B CRISPR module RAMP protein Cmr1, partial [Synergistetes bacterium]|nr:type III-B CRISPR module RAMP protein Cmr1 [Synergistota bacterium]
MHKVSLEVETVTPLFIAGADQRNIGNEGLRPPSLRGLLRWWFRAALGG